MFTLNVETANTVENFIIASFSSMVDQNEKL